MKRKPIPQEIRQQVYEMYDGHCAYCGCELKYEDMQVDHKESIYVAEYEVKEAEGKVVAEGSAFPTYEEALSMAVRMAVEHLKEKQDGRL